jgi:hypothetical protein
VTSAGTNILLTFGEEIVSSDLDTIARKLANLMNISVSSIAEMRIVDGKSISFSILDQPNTNTSHIAALKLLETVQNLQTTNQTFLGYSVKSVGETQFIGRTVWSFLCIIYILGCINSS